MTVTPATGVDLLGLTLDLERRIDLKIPYGDVRELVADGDLRAGDLFELIAGRLGALKAAQQDIPANRALWTSVRAALSEVSGVPVDEVGMDSKLEDLLPREVRAKMWSRFVDGIDLRVPELGYPRWVIWLGTILATGVIVLEQIQLWQLPLIPKFALLFLGLLLSTEAVVRVVRLLRPFRNRVPDDIATVKRLCRKIVRLNYQRLSSGRVLPVDNDAVWGELREVLVHWMGVDPDEVTPELPIWQLRMDD